MRVGKGSIIWTFVLGASFGPSSNAQSLVDSGLVIEPVVNQSHQLTGMTFIGPDRFLLIERATGFVRLYENGQLLEEPVLELPVPAVGSHDGLLGITKDPHFDANGYVYVYYTRDVDGGDPIDRLSRFVWTGHSFDAGSEFVLRELAGSPPVHHGGVIAFGPDEKLYLVTGDRGQNTLTTNQITGDPSEVAVILRINPDGTAPADNPFQVRGFEYIYGYGVRNSFGMAIDPLTGHVWNTENGTGEGAEELNLYPPGGNGGWNRVIGFSEAPPPDLVLVPGATYIEPKLQYFGVPTSLVFQPSPVLGADNWNRLFLGFFVSPDSQQNSILRFRLNTNRDGLSFESPGLQDLVVNMADSLDEVGFARQLNFITDMEIGPDGFLYVVRFTSPGVYRIRPNHPTGDVDRDGDLDMADAARLQRCFSGANPVNPPTQECREGLDVDEDGDVDVGDVSAIHAIFSGPLSLF
jgi:hypothetical protein